MSSKSNPNLKLGFIGCGNMGGAVMSGFISSGAVKPQNVFISVRTLQSAERLSQNYPGVSTFTDSVQMINNSNASLFFLCIKPYMFADFAKDVEIQKALEGKTLVSMLAGISLQQMRTGFPSEKISLARIMPNVPCRVLKGCTTICIPPGGSPELADLLKELCDSIGLAVVLEEKLIDATTAMTGSGPAFVM